ncbi:hypothetical protein B0I35DRAFT_426581 [Stachybotrys elegans]|uniref:DUF6594 domain-containing protein n=1 Tax=Stachybotrys elegans TaxID=80388 RepID=A0A8K0SRV1_9HYPO|nr:hypothetical protein B0I35DRAFT_426581 [Stachybotrys elegans]
MASSDVTSGSEAAPAPFITIRSSDARSRRSEGSDLEVNGPTPPPSIRSPGTSDGPNQGLSIIQSSAGPRHERRRLRRPGGSTANARDQPPFYDGERPHPRERRPSDHFPSSTPEQRQGMIYFDPHHDSSPAHSRPGSHVDFPTGPPNAHASPHLGHFHHNGFQGSELDSPGPRSHIHPLPNGSPADSRFDNPRFDGPMPFAPQPPAIQDVAHGGPPVPPGPLPFLQTQFPGQAQLAIAQESLPLTGYELLAAKLSGSMDGPPIRPIYRRFDMLRHRILLRLQAELIELEEVIHMLDAQDAQARQAPGGFWPASARLEMSKANELSVQKTNILGQISVKLGQYNEIIASFKHAHDVPTRRDIEHYRQFLAAGRPIVEEETRFLDAKEDLITLHTGAPDARRAPVESLFAIDRHPPVAETGFPPGSPHSFTGSAKSEPLPSARPPEQTEAGMVAYAMVAMFVAILVPILTFSVIPGFVARMTVVMLMGSGVLTMLVQSGPLKQMMDSRGALDWVVAGAIYIGAMAVIAGTFG